MVLRKTLGCIFKRFTSIKFNTDDLLNFLASIDVKTNNPFDLYKDWVKAAPNTVSKSYWSLANYSKKNNTVHNRYVQIFHVKDNQKDKFVFVTDKRTEKCQDFNSCPKVSIATLWQYNDLKFKVIRQIRADGQLKKCSSELCEKIFDKFSLAARIKWHLCQQNKKLHSWCILQYAFQNVVNEVRNEITQRSSDINMPKHMIAYEIDIEKMYFYHSISGKKIKFVPDRVVFEKIPNESNKWNFMHITS